MQAFDYVLDQVEEAEVVQHCRVKWRGGRAFLLVTAHVNVGVIGAQVRQAVDEPRVAVVGENDRLVLRAQDVKRMVAHALRVLAGLLQLHQVDLVDDADFQTRDRSAQDGNGGERFLGGPIRRSAVAQESPIKNPLCPDGTEPPSTVRLSKSNESSRLLGNLYRLSGAAYGTRC